MGAVMRSLIALWILLVSIPALAGISECERLLKVLNRVAPPEEAKVWGQSGLQAKAPRSAEATEILKPSAEVQVGKKGPLKILVEDPSFFLLAHMHLKNNGFWMITSPTSANQRLSTGHASIVVGDHLFNRLSDDLGENAMRSIPVRQVAAAFMQSNDQPYLIAQFYELSQPSTETLSKFFHDRTWNYHAGKKEWRPTYERLPLGDEGKGKNCENCSLFSWSFMDPKWTEISPELRQVQTEIGEIVVDQLPLHQVYNNAQNGAYRGTILVAKDADGARQALKDDTFTNDALGAQTFFHGFKELNLKPGLE